MPSCYQIAQFMDVGSRYMGNHYVVVAHDAVFQSARAIGSEPGGLQFLKWAVGGGRKGIDAVADPVDDSSVHKS